MRVIAGKLRGRRLASLPGTSTRPMLGRMRQTLFDILQSRVGGCVFADLYAGTGAVGIEALSRGADRAVFVESNSAAVRIIRRNLEALGLEGRSEVRCAPVDRALRSVTADVFFLGPPYEAALEYSRTLALLSERPVEWVIAQHGARMDLAERYGSLTRVRVVRIGSNRLSMFLARDLPAVSLEGGVQDRT